MISAGKTILKSLIKSNLTSKLPSACSFTFIIVLLLSWNVGKGQLTLSGTSYSQNFDGIATTGLPTGWSVRTGASSSALGTIQALNTTSTSWANTTGQFQNSAAAELPATSADASVTQGTRTDRVIAVRQVSAFGDGSAAFVLQIANTTGFNTFSLSFKLMQLDPGTAGRTATWNVDYGFGASPTSFANIATNPVTLTTTTGTWGSTSVSVNFGTALDDNSGPVWIRVVTKSATTGSSNRPVTAIDDYNLTWTSCTAPSNPTGTISGTTPACASTILSFSDAAPAGITYYWQTSNNGKLTDNNASSSLNVTSSGNYFVRARNNTTGCWSAGSVGGYSVTINTAPSITSQPAISTATCDSYTGNLSLTASGTNLNYDWQYSANGTTGWNSVANGTPNASVTYSTTTPATLGIFGLTQTGYYRCVVSN